MPKFLENKLKKEYGADSATPYKIMNKLGFMHGSKETPKGKAADQKHHSMLRKGMKKSSSPAKEMPESMKKY